MNNNFREIKFNINNNGFWKINFENLSDKKQTLLVFCNINTEPLLHITINNYNISIGYYNGKDWQHEKIGVTIKESCQLEYCVTNSDVIFYLDDKQIFNLNKNILQNAKKATIGVSSQMTGDKFYLDDKVFFSYKKEARDSKYIEIKQVNDNYKILDFDSNSTNNMLIKYNNIDLLTNQTLFVLGKKDDDNKIQPKIKLQLCDNNFLFYYMNMKNNTLEKSVFSFIEKKQKINNKNMEIEIFRDVHFTYIFVDDDLLVFRWNNLIEECDVFIIGSCKNVIDENYFLSNDVNFSYENNYYIKNKNFDKPQISIVISAYIENYEHFSKTINCIHNIHKYTKIPYEIVLVNDGSCCNYFDIWENDSELFKNNIRIFHNKSNSGISISRNLGGLKSRGDFIIFLDNDQLVFDEWDEQYYKILVSQDKCIVGENRKHENIFFSSQPVEDTSVGDFSYINGGGLALSKKSFIKLEGFDEDFSPMYCEDSDLSWRAMKLGYDLIPIKIKKYIYHHKESTIKNMENSEEYFFKNHIKLFKKHRERFDIQSQKEKQKVLFLMNSTFVGGAENALSNIITTTEIEKHVVVLRESNTWIQNKINNNSDYFFCLEESKNMNKILFYCIIHNIDLIVYNNFNYDLKFKLTDKISTYFPSIKIIDVVCDNWYWDSLEKTSESVGVNYTRYLNQIDYFICKNNNMKQQFYKRNLYNISVIPNGVEFKQELSYLKNKKSDRFTAITISRISQEKRIELILEIAQSLPEIDFVIVGGPSGKHRQEYYEEIQKEAQKIPNIIMTGEISKDEIWGKLSEADLFIFASKEEGCPNVLLEAMSIGLPILAFDVVGVNEVVNNDIGYLVETKDEFISVLGNIRNNISVLKNKSQNALQQVEEKYSIDLMTHSYVEKFQQVVENNLIMRKNYQSKICIMVPTLGVGGAEKIALEQLEYLNQNGLDCNLWYFNDYFVEFEPKNKLEKYIQKNSGNINDFVKKSDYDLYISHILPIKELLGTNKKIINTIHSPSLFSKSNIDDMKNDGQIIYHCLSNFVYSMIAPYIFENEFFILPHGVYIPQYDKMKTKNNMGIQKDEFVLAHVGKNSKIKNTHKTLDVFEEFSKNHKTKLLLIGNMEIPIENENYDLDIIDRIRNNSDILYQGVLQEDCQQKLAVADCYINTSYSEGLPISILEAMSLGIPCVSHDVGGISEIINNNQNGYLLGVNSSVNDFVEKIDLVREGKIKQHDCVDKIIDNYNFAINMEKYLSIIQGLL